MNRQRSFQILLLLFSFTLAGCGAQQLSARSSTFDYLFAETDPAPATSGPAQLRLPLRVGLAFVPNEEVSHSSSNIDLLGTASSAVKTNNKLNEATKVALMEQVASRFRDYKFVQSMQILPSSALRQGGLDELDQLRALFNIDVIVLVAYDQVQFSDPNKNSLSYWTGVGAYFFKGDRTDTRTAIDTMVYHIAGRRLLFHAQGISVVGNKATSVGVSQQLREDSSKGYMLASADMVNKLDRALAEFRRQASAQPGQGVEIIKPAGYDATPDRIPGGALGGKEP